MLENNDRIVFWRGPWPLHPDDTDCCMLEQRLEIMALEMKYTLPQASIECDANALSKSATSEQLPWQFKILFQFMWALHLENYWLQQNYWDCPEKFHEIFCPFLNVGSEKFLSEFEINQNPMEKQLTVSYHTLMLCFDHVLVITLLMHESIWQNWTYQVVLTWA